MTHDFKPGDILVNTWGATMTLVDFYQVVKTTAATVTVRHIGEKDNTPGGFLEGTVMPDTSVTERSRDCPDGHFVRRVAVGYDGKPCIRGHNSSGCAYKWDGRPVHYNHCD